MNGAGIQSLLLAMLAALLLVEPAVAADSGTTRTVRSSAASRTRRSRAAEQAAEKALRDVFHASSAMNRARSIKQHDFELSPEWQNALAEARQARASFEHARSEALAQLEHDGQYKAAKIDIWKSSEAVKTTKDPSKLASLSSDLLKKRTAVSNMEAARLANDDAFRQARDALADAERKLATLRKDLADAIRTDPQGQQARAQYYAARARLMVNG
jgi:hypothetical protein